MKTQSSYRACLLAVERSLSRGCLVLCLSQQPLSPHHTLPCVLKDMFSIGISLGVFSSLVKIIIIIIIFVSPPTTDYHLSHGSAPHYLSLSVKFAPPCFPSVDWIGICVGIGNLGHRVSVHLFLFYLRGLFCVFGPGKKPPELPPS